MPPCQSQRQHQPCHTVLEGLLSFVIETVGPWSGLPLLCHQRCCMPWWCEPGGKVEITSSTPPSTKVLRIMSAQSARRLQTQHPPGCWRYSLSGRVGYSAQGDRETLKCFVYNVGADETTVLRTFTLVFAVATTLKPAAVWYIQFSWEYTLALRIDCRPDLVRCGQPHLETTRLPSKAQQRVRCANISPATRRKPPVRSSSSVSLVMLTRIKFPSQLSTSLAQHRRSYHP